MTDRHALPRAAGSIRLIGEKKNHRLSRWVAFLLLQQYLPFTVLKLTINTELIHRLSPLQQYLPFTVLKLWMPITEWFFIIGCNSTYRLRYWNVLSNRNNRILQVATVLTVYGIETIVIWLVTFCFAPRVVRCNSTYRLRYWNRMGFQLQGNLSQVATVLTVYGIETFVR